jgi:hypothetical protein
MTVVKVVGLVKGGVNGRKGSKYPVSDQVIDVAVMAGVNAVIGILEVVLAVWRVQRRKRANRESVGRSSVVETEFVGSEARVCFVAGTITDNK